MSKKKTIRVVKKGADNRKTAKPKVDSAREVAREMVGTVTNWVTEFQQKRRNETRNALSKEQRAKSKAQRAKGKLLALGS